MLSWGSKRESYTGHICAIISDVIPVYQRKLQGNDLSATRAHLQIFAVPVWRSIRRVWQSEAVLAMGFLRYPDLLGSILPRDL